MNNVNAPVEIDADAAGEFIIYKTSDERTEVHLRVVDGNVWMTQAEIAALFGISVPTISIHLKEIYQENELTRDRTLRKLQRVQNEGDRDIVRSLNHYNLDAIMAVGYRVRGPRGVQFRTWATSVLKEYLVKGFAMNDEKLKDPRGVDYFDELLERIRDIRSSEARFYSKIREIFSMSVDYDKNNKASHMLFKAVQDKLHYAITGLTSSEIIATRCDPKADNLGLTNFKGIKVLQKDTLVAKNYLTKDELHSLNLLVTQFLDYAEQQALRKKVIYMKDWIGKTDGFIEFNEFEPLPDHGRIQRNEAEKLAKQRYALFDSRRRKKEEAEIASEVLEELKAIDRRILADRARLTPRKKEE